MNFLKTKLIALTIVAVLIGLLGSCGKVQDTRAKRDAEKDRDSLLYGDTLKFIINSQPLQRVAR